MNVLLLDFGSSFVKYSFFDTETRINTEVYSLEFPKPSVDEDGIYEVERRLIDNLLLEIMNETLEKGCKRVFISVQMHGYLIRSCGEFSNYISWKDKRGARYLGAEECTDLYEYGSALKANLARVSLRGYGDLSGCEFFTLGSYISYVLTGNNITHLTDACASGFFKADTGDVDPVFSGLSLPQAMAQIDICGSYKGIDIYAPMGDHQVSFLGADARSCELVLNLGTAAQLSFLVKEGTGRARGIEYRPYFAKGIRVATLSGVCTKDKEALLARIKEYVGAFDSAKRIIITGGASDKYGYFEDELKKLGFDAIPCEGNAGNEGLRKIAEGACAVRGTMLSEIDFVNFPFLLKKADLDFFIIDNEHGIFENKNITALAMNSKHAGIRAIVRIPDNGRAMITKLCDGGVNEFLLPMTNTRADIEKLVQYAKYTPIGKRGISTTRAHTGYGVSNIGEYLVSANKRMKIYAQIETRLGVENVESIAATEGVEGIFIGPNDLSCDYNCMGNNEKIKELISVIAGACQKIGKPCGIITTDRELIRHALLCGCSMVSYGSELNMLINGAKEIKNGKYL